MVRHQRQHHQLGEDWSQLDETSSESGMEFPTTPNSSPALQDHHLPRSPSYASLGPPLDGYSPQEYHASPVPEQQRFVQAFDNPAPGQAAYYPPEQLNLAAATMNINSMPEYQARAPISSNPGAFSPIAVPPQAGYYKPAQPSPIIPPQHAMGQYLPVAPQQMHLIPPEAQAHFQHPPNPQWASGIAYPAVPMYSLMGYHYWGLKPDDGLSTLMQGARIESLEGGLVV
ncbi:hypothetical protein F4861DRAFT_547077 [Xylaria intraflava]|nr:hypothetical protein F4861DRAFT_547077 [Xylaria intraflava]